MKVALTGSYVVVEENFFLIAPLVKCRYLEIRGGGDKLEEKF